MTVLAAGLLALFTIVTVTSAFAGTPVRRPRERRADIEYWPGLLHNPEGAR